MKMPIEILDEFEKAATGLVYGNAILTLSVKQGKVHYVIAREESFIPAEDESSTQPVSNTKMRGQKSCKNNNPEALF
jgi:hypothetical protein